MANGSLAKGLFLLGGLVVSIIAGDYACAQKNRYKEGILAQIVTPADVIRLFPSSVEEIETRTASGMQEAQKAVQAIVEVPSDQKTFENTVDALDHLCALSNLAITVPTLKMLEVLYPEQMLRLAAHKAVQKAEGFIVDTITNNEALYAALKDYAQHGALQESLSLEQRYYLAEKMKEFERAGLALDNTKRLLISELKKEIAQLSQAFATNISNENRTITVRKKDLDGLGVDFINTLRKNDNGEYVLGLDYPTYFEVMSNCSVSDTRKRLWEQFNNRAYPANDVLLRQIIQKRDELAKISGYASYADLQLSNSMVGSPQNAHSFLDTLLGRVNAKVDAEVALMMNHLPAGVSRTVDGTINEWDWGYIVNCYKKNHFSIDENSIAEYFPMEKTIEGLLDIYRQFMSVDFKTVSVSGLWHPDVRMISVADRTGATLGYLLLDLYPRENKYSHACEETIVPAIINKEGKNSVAVALVVANFPKSTATKPSLLKRSDARTFFHEFGHAMHTLLGRTRIASFSGTTAPGATPLSLVKLDFVEMPSQMLEEWLWDAHILKNLSSHYKTGEQLPDEVISNILQLKRLVSGDGIQRQIFQAKLSLAYYALGESKDPYNIMKELYTAIRPHFNFEMSNRFYAGFGHLTDYGAQYYGYLWSLVFALDLFSQIKQEGLLNPAIGTKYITQVIGKGGSEDPNVLLKNFLGREPNADAFFADLGL